MYFNHTICISCCPFFLCMVLSNILFLSRVQLQVFPPAAGVRLCTARRLCDSEVHGAHWNQWQRTQCLLVQKGHRKLPPGNHVRPHTQQHSVCERYRVWVSCTELCVQFTKKECEPVWCWNILLCCGFMWTDTDWERNETGCWRWAAHLFIIIFNWIPTLLIHVTYS